MEKYYLCSIQSKTNPNQNDTVLVFVDEISAYTRLREYFDFYAVPLRLLWKSAPSVLTQMQDINQIQALSLTQNLALGTYLPSLSLSSFYSALAYLAGNTSNPGTPSSLKNLFGFDRADLSYKLLNYLGYGNIIKDGVSEGWTFQCKKP
jgi:hypothetical protein